MAGSLVAVGDRSGECRLRGQGGGQPVAVFVAGDFDGAEDLEMGGEELGIEQTEAAAAQALDQMHQGDLAGVGLAAEHAFAEEGAAEDHPVKPADQFALAPALHAMGRAALVQGNVEALDVPIDPGFPALRPGFGAGLDH